MVDSEPGEPRPDGGATLRMGHAAFGVISEPWKEPNITVEKKVFTPISVFFFQVPLFFGDAQPSTPHLNEPDS